MTGETSGRWRLVCAGQGDLREGGKRGLVLATDRCPFPEVWPVTLPRYPNPPRQQRLHQPSLLVVEVRVHLHLLSLPKDGILLLAKRATVYLS
jgi:hypothetical protein